MSKTFQNSQVPNLLPSFKGFKNRIINGDFAVWQRGESFSLESDSTNDTMVFIYTADRVECGNVRAGGKFTVSKGNLNGYNSFKVTVDSPPDNLTWDGTNGRYWLPFYYTFEGQHLYDLAIQKKNITISFIFRSNVAGNFTVTLRNISYTGQTGKWDATKNDYYVTYFSYDGSEKPIRVSIKIPLDNDWVYGVFNDEKRGFNLFIAPIGEYSKTSTVNTWFVGSVPDSYNYEGSVNWASQAGNYIEIAQLQLEEGTVATEFERIPYDIQLERCKRYFEKFTTTILKAVGKDDTFGVISYKEKRVTPAIKLMSPASGAIGKMRYYSADTNDRDKDVPITVLGWFTYHYLPNKTHALIGINNFTPNLANDALGVVTVELDAEL